MAEHCAHAADPPERRHLRIQSDAEIGQKLAKCRGINGAKLAVMVCGEPLRVEAQLAFKMLKETIDCHSSAISGRSIGRAAVEMILFVDAVPDQSLCQIALSSTGKRSTEHQ